ncbi:Protein BEST-8 [Aphelenchoides avenae]|nr:Protein BEST-8 [Aphelenchus avenae]
MLGFYVKAVVERWERIFANIGFVDNCAFFASTYIRGTDKETRMIRRNIVRYLCLTQVMVLRDISIRVRKRFPTHDSLVETGFLQPHEKAVMDNVKCDYTKYWMPINWVFSLIYEMRERGKINSDTMTNGFLKEVKKYRCRLQTLCNYDWVPIPLAYPQVVGLAVRVYFFVCLVSRQHVEEGEDKTLLYYVPFMSMFQFIFYMGWLKVAEALLNPLGEDDDDFEGNYMIDRNIAIGMSMVDSVMPSQQPDTFPNDAQPPTYTEQSAVPVHPLVGSAKKAALRESASAANLPHFAELRQASSRRHSVVPHMGGSEYQFPRRMSLPPKKPENLELGGAKSVENRVNDNGAASSVQFVPNGQQLGGPALFHLDTVSEEGTPPSTIDGKFNAFRK